MSRPATPSLQLTLYSERAQTERLSPPCVLCGSALSAQELKQVASLLSLPSHTQLSQQPLEGLTSRAQLPKVLAAPSVVGVLKEREGVLLFEPSVSGDLAFKVEHLRNGELAKLDADAVELWDGDRLRFCYEERSLELRVELHEREDEQGEVIAERAIEEVERYASRLLNSAEAGELAMSRLHLLFKHSQALGQSGDLNATLKATSALIFDLIERATHVAIALRQDSTFTSERGDERGDERGNERGDTLTKKRAHKRSAPLNFPVVYSARRAGGEVELPMSRTLIKRVVQERKALLLMDAASEVGGARSVLAAGLSSVMMVPLWVGADICGVVQVDNRDQPSVFGAEVLELLMVGLSTASFALESARLITRLKVAEEQLTGGLRYLQTPERQEASGLIGESASMRAVALSIERVKDLKVPVFIKGETGTGKELIARALHYQSVRQGKLFVAQNCGALPEGILESELFGHTKGAFTGADRDKKGLFELADGGTVFLDEIGEMPHALQSKLLRVLQEGEVWPLGASRPKQVDVRVLSATHRDLDEMVAEGSFRQDLYYRLHVYPIHLPPLRERGEDVALLARAFLARYAKEFGRGVSAFSEPALRALSHYAWPGNVRELQNEVQRALISRFEGDLILLEDLSPHISGVSPHEPDIVLEALGVEGTLKEMMEHLERALLKRALASHDDNKTQTAKALGITREGLHKKLNRLGVGAEADEPHGAEALEGGEP